MLRSLCVVTFVLTLCAASASAAVLFGTAGSGLYTIDPANGMTIPRGTGTGSTRDLTSDWRPGTTRMWGTGSVGLNEMLVRFNTVTGGSNVVGSYNLPTGRAMRSLAFDVTSGTLFGVAEDAPFGAGNNFLYEINYDTAAVTLRGTVAFRAVGALAFDLSGRLFGVSNVPEETNLIEIDPQTAAATLIAPVALDSIGDLAPRPEDGVMFAVSAEVPLSGLNQLHAIDTSNGAVTLLTQVMQGTPFNGLAFVPEPSAAVAMVLAWGAALVRRRRA